MNKAIAAMAVLCTLSACNAMKGLGKDIQSLGNSIETAAVKGQKVEKPKPHTGYPQAQSTQTLQAYPAPTVDIKELEKKRY